MGDGCASMQIRHANSTVIADVVSIGIWPAMFGDIQAFIECLAQYGATLMQGTMTPQCDSTSDPVHRYL
ncbi:predicted protein [Plenodomus lingam JN3]|uniref:Predicted protein n=1 Tax=Leptosphaeria maculans (strain JN3 / isolate v23.1.3 / race Av1-4-5-6-7-8) TaxID=985895 RepID=E5AEB3_LEPMJ|nr:predicted protein [Plenodomus lingam JN3]CBY01552.1 predicted protein [Plenodomus lingam JN3]